MIQIAIQDLNDQVLELSLDGETFYLHLAWNDTCQYWSAGISDSAQDVLVDGLAIVPDAALFGGVSNVALPAGALLAVTPDRRDSISRADLVNGIVALLYASVADLVSAS